MLAAGARDDGRAAAPQRRGVEDVVVDERRHVDELDRGRGADRAVAGVRPGAEQDEHRPQALAAGRERRRGLAREAVSPSRDDLAEARLDRGHARGSQRRRGVDDAGDRRRDVGAGHGRDAGVDRDDPAGEHRAADPLEAGRGP